MKRLLPLLAALALPTAVNAESYWLIIHWNDGNNSALEKVEVQSPDHCLEEGRKWEQSTTQRTLRKKARTFHCVVGK